MFEHAVMFRFHDAKEAAVVQEKLEALRGKIETLRSLRCVTNTLQSERSSDLLLLTGFDDEAGYRTYDTHPLHVEVKQYIGTVASGSTTVDGWIDEE